jgi:hypothetical protein
MSTVVEDRLTAALHARAELVQSEDLRRLTLQVPRPTPIWRRPVVVALVAAAAVLAVVVPLATRGHRTDVHPLPSDHVPVPSTPLEHSLTGDLDGDGRADRVLVSGDTLRFTLAADRAHPMTARVHDVAGLVGLLDAGTPGRVVVVATSNKSLTGQSWRAYTVDGGKLHVVPVRTRSTGNDPTYDGIAFYPTHSFSWITSDGVLMTGVLDPAQGGTQLAVQVSRSVPKGGGLVQQPVGRWCWDTATQNLPAPCPAGVSYGFDPGQHGSLPALLPIADPAWIWPLGPRSWHEGRTRLRIVEAHPHTRSPIDQVYEVVGTIDGRHVSAPLGKERPRLFTTYVDLGHGVRGLAADVGGETSHLLSATVDGLVPLSVKDPTHGSSGGLYLHPGTFAVTDGRDVRAAATWIAGGKVFTRVETGAFDRFQTYEWQVTDSSGTTLTPVDLGVVCMDDFEGTYGTCAG